MSTKLLICDDSNMARKQVARSLPDDWDIEISFATNGAEGIEAIKAGKGDVLLLDLNMPVMDGYQVLEEILKQDLNTLTVVISGDIQPEAHERVKRLGALDFIQKPVNKNKLTEILLQYGLFTCEDIFENFTPSEFDTSDFIENISQMDLPSEQIKGKNVAGRKDKVVLPPLTQSATLVTEIQTENTNTELLLPADLRDCYQEIANVAMGRAGDLLARLLDVFVLLPIPNVNLIEASELSMAITSVDDKESTSGICQGFIGAGISGEALLILNDSSFKDIARLMNYGLDVDKKAELELLMDMANVLIGACLSGISEQLDMPFSQGHPIVLGQHRNIRSLIANNSSRWQKTLAIEISYNIENYPIKCDLLLLFTEDSLRTLNNKISYLLD